MLKKLSFILIFGILLFIQGCATHSNFIKKYDASVGTNISQLMATIGYPDTTFTLPNKNKVYVYERSRVYTLPTPVLGYGYGGYYGGFNMFGYGDEMIQESCKLFIETNKKGTIVKWGSRGNHCVSNPPLIKEIK